MATGALVVQRLGQGWVRLTTADGVATWDGIHWSTKPLSMTLVERVAPHAAGRRPRRAGQPAGAVHALAGRRPRRRDARVAPRRRRRRPRRPRPAGVGGDPAARPAPPLPLRRPAQRPRPVRPGRARRPAGRVVERVGVHLRSSERSATRSRPTAARGTPRRCASRPTSPAPPPSSCRRTARCRCSSTASAWRPTDRAQSKSKRSSRKPRRLRLRPSGGRSRSS